jgi:CheY-like chemotaxis protein
LGELNDRQSRYVHLIYQSGRQLMLVVNDILDLTRIETDQVELVPEPVNIARVCDRAYLQAQQRLLSHHTQEEVENSLERQFTLAIAPELQTVVADELRLRQILCHLLANALKFTESNEALGLEVSRCSHWIAFTVWDNGIGIPLDKQHLIFQKFQQLENPLTRRFNGTGLGLVLAQRLARLHGGDISFVSHPDRGSRFTVLLPAEDFWEAGTEEVHDGNDIKDINDINFAHPHQSSKSSKPSNLILVIEPIPQHVDNLSLHLEELGYCVVIARCGTEALEKARHLRPCLCFLNPLLPLLSGWDVLVLLKSDPQTRHIPILITATPGEKTDAYAHQADGFLSLPVEQTVLKQYLQQVLQRDKGHLLDDRPISLTILILSPQASPLSPGQSPDFSCLSNLLNQAIHQDPQGIKCRILEVDDLEQAELLAQVWHPDVLLFNGKEVVELTPYLEKLAAHHSLASLPLITLDHAMTEAANSIGNLAVFPCLAADSCLFGSELNACYSLLQVIDVAIFSHQGKSF